MIGPLFISDATNPPVPLKVSGIQLYGKRFVAEIKKQEGLWSEHPPIYRESDNRFTPLLRGGETGVVPVHERW